MGTGRKLDLPGDEEDYMSFALDVPRTTTPTTKKRTITERMKDARDAGLQTPLGDENMGYRMLRAMGYKGDAVATTVDLPDRSGLGLVRPQFLFDDTNFRTATKLHADDRTLQRALRRVRSAIHDLDERRGLQSAFDKDDLDELRAAVTYLRDVHQYSLSHGDNDIEAEITALLDEAQE